MAERRMFAKSIVASDAFLGMPTHAQLLYFHCILNASNKGVVNCAMRICRELDIHRHNIEILNQYGYFIPLDEYCYKIAHWDEHNGYGEHAKYRNTYQYRQWRRDVLRRDGFMCKQCGSTKTLQAHHIKPFAIYKDLRFDVSNGITLCSDCHRRIHFGVT